MAFLKLKITFYENTSKKIEYTGINTQVISKTHENNKRQYYKVQAGHSPTCKVKSGQLTQLFSTAFQLFLNSYPTYFQLRFNRS
jgi:hypothetical protein